MTENKRYTSDIHRIYDDNEEIGCADTMDDAEVIVDLLNEQEELIKELKDYQEVLSKDLAKCADNRIKNQERIKELEKAIKTYDDGCKEIYNDKCKLEKENRTLKITYAKCRDCKHADLYNPEFAYPYLDPQCKLNVKSIHSDSDACEDFEMIGRNGR